MLLSKVDAASFWICFFSWTERSVLRQGLCISGGELSLIPTCVTIYPPIVVIVGRSGVRQPNLVYLSNGKRGREKGYSRIVF